MADRKPKRPSRIMIYGATGFTGGLVTEAARTLPCEFVLGGRDAGRLERTARPLGLRACAFALGEPAETANALANVDLVLNAAGPFGATAVPLMAACVETGTHYLDVAGELSVFAAAHRYDAAARQRGIMLMPGVGFTIAASDCLAAHAAAVLPGAKYLRLGFSQPAKLSRGSLRTVVAELRGRVAIRRAGRLSSISAGTLEREFDYGQGPQSSAALSFADVFTAYFTTGIPNIESYLEANALVRFTGPFLGQLTEVLRLTPFHPVMGVGLAGWPRMFPPQSDRPVHHQVIVAEVEDSWRRTRRVMMWTSDGYSFTASAAAEIMKRALAGELASGFQTPARLYGADLALAIPGTIRQDLTEAADQKASVARRGHHG
jgi:short subunit dehydrogenase-like uncharacterized protein